MLRRSLGSARACFIVPTGALRPVDDRCGYDQPFVRLIAADGSFPMLAC
jgi:hypothetical protein